MEDALSIAIAFIKPAEGFSLKAYKDGGGVFTIGWGETQNVREGDVWTLAQCEDKIQGRVLWFMQNVLKSCPQLHLEPPHMLAACTSLAYNIGVTAFAKSTLVKMIIAENFDGAAKQFLRWNMDNGKVVKGLTNRRIREMDLFMTGKYDV